MKCEKCGSAHTLIITRELLHCNQCGTETPHAMPTHILVPERVFTSGEESRPDLVLHPVARWNNDQPYVRYGDRLVPVAQWLDKAEHT